MDSGCTSFTPSAGGPQAGARFAASNVLHSSPAQATRAVLCFIDSFTVADDETLKVWEAETGRELATLEGHEASVNGCAVTPDGRRVVQSPLTRHLKPCDVQGCLMRRRKH